MEIRFFAPGSLVSNLDFVESIFGNGGDPYLPENDAGARRHALDRPHRLRDPGAASGRDSEEGPRAAALRATPPNASGATACAGRDADEPYNGGGAFKITCRDRRGVMVTIIADNYYGYCKKEVKTQISFAANLFGLCEEEHAGGAMAFADLRARAGFLRRPHVSVSRTARFRRRHATARRPGRAAARRLRGRQALSRTSSTCRRTPISACAKAASAGSATGTRRSVCRCAPATSTCCRPGSGSAWKSRPAARRGGWSASRPRRHALPQALHGFRRRQVRDLEIDRRRPAEGPVFVATITATWTRWRKSCSRTSPRSISNRPPDERTRAADPEPGALAGLGDQAADAVAGIHRRAQRVAAPAVRRPCANWSSPSSATTGRSGATTGASISRVDRINGFLGHELKFDNQKLVEQLPARRLRSRWLLADLQAAAGFLSRRQGAGGGRHHGLGGAAARAPERSRSRVRQSQRQAGGELRDAAVPAAGRRDPSRRRQAGRSGYRRRRTPSFPTSSRSRWSRRGRWSITWWSSTSTPSR